MLQAILFCCDQKRALFFAQGQKNKSHLLSQPEAEK